MLWTMDDTPTFVVLLSLAAVSAAVSYLMARPLAKRTKENMTKAVTEVISESAFLTDRYAVYEDEPEWKYWLGPVILSILTNGFFLGYLLDPKWGGIDADAFYLYVTFVMGAGILLPLGLDYLQLALTNKVVIVSDEGLELHKLGSSGLEMTRSFKWEEVGHVAAGESRRGPHHSQFAISGANGRMKLWSYWANFGYFAKKMLRFVPPEKISRYALGVLKWGAARVEPD